MALVGALAPAFGSCPFAQTFSMQRLLNMEQSNKEMIESECKMKLGTLITTLIIYLEHVDLVTKHTENENDLYIFRSK